MELCKTVIEHNRRFNQTFQSEIIRETAIGCPERKQAIENAIKNYNFENTSKSFGIQMENRMADVKSDIIEAPHLEYSGQIEKNIGNSGRWNNTKKKFILPGKSDNCLLINCSYSNNIENLRQKLISLSKDHAVILNKIELIDYPYDEVKEHQVKEFLSEKIKTTKYDFIVAVVCDQHPNFYSKKF